MGLEGSVQWVQGFVKRNEISGVQAQMDAWSKVEFWVRGHQAFPCWCRGSVTLTHPDTHRNFTQGSWRALVCMTRYGTLWEGAVCMPCSTGHMGICHSQSPHMAGCRLLSATPGFVVVPLTRAALMRKATQAFTGTPGRETAHLRVLASPCFSLT